MAVAETKAMQTSTDSIPEAAAADAADDMVEITDDMIVEVWADPGPTERRTPPPIPGSRASDAGARPRRPATRLPRWRRPTRQ
jgi:hypothetical protein